MYVCIPDTYNITFACDKVSDTVPFNLEVVMLELELSKEHYFFVCILYRFVRSQSSLKIWIVFQGFHQKLLGFLLTFIRELSLKNIRNISV